MLWAPERGDVLLLCELVLNEGVEEFVVEGLVPGLAGEHCAEVRAALTHDRLEADHGGALGCHCHVLGGCRESNNVGPVVGKHRLVPRGAQLQPRVGEPHPHRYVHHRRMVIDTRNGLQEFSKRYLQYTTAM